MRSRVSYQRRPTPLCALLALAVTCACVLQAAPCVAQTQASNESENEPPPQEAIEAYQRAREHYKAGRYPAAIEALERALSLDPDSPDLVYNVARVYELMGELGQAVLYYERYRSMLPTEETEERKRVSETIRRLRGAQEYVEPEPEDPPPPPERKRGVADTTFWATASVAAASLIGGAVTGGLALQKESRAKDFVLGSDGTLAQYNSLTQQADRLAVSSDLLLAAGGVAGVTALLLYVLRTRPVERAPEAGRAALRVGAGLGRGTLSVGVGGQF